MGYATKQRCLNVVTIGWRIWHIESKGRPFPRVGLMVSIPSPDADGRGNPEILGQTWILRYVLVCHQWLEGCPDRSWILETSQLQSTCVGFFLSPWLEVNYNNKLHFWNSRRILGIHPGFTMWKCRYDENPWWYMHLPTLRKVSFTYLDIYDTAVDGRNRANQLRLVVYHLNCRVLYISGGCLGFLNHQQ